MKNRVLRTSIMGACLLAAIPFASAQVTLGATADADAVAGTSSTGDDFGDNNFGSRPWISENWLGATSVLAHIKFDVSSFAAGTVTSATLRLYQDFNPQDGITFDVFQVLQDWGEATLTYDTRPTLAGSAASSMTISGSAPGLYREWDVTSLVQAWVNGAADNFGMAVIRDPDSDPWPYFRSRENVNGGNPQLVVNAVPEPASMAALAVGAAALLRRRRK